MTPGSKRQLAIGVYLFAALILVSVTACGGSSQTPNASSAVPLSSSAATPSITSPGPSGSLAPSASAGDCKLGALRTGPKTLSTTDPNISLDLPEGYRGVHLAVYRRALRASADQQSDPAAKRDLEATMRLIDTGEIRGVAYGLSGAVCAQDTMTLRIPKADSLDDAVAAWLEDREGRSAKYELMSRKSVSLSVGPATRLVVQIKSRTSGAPFGRSLVYFVRLEDGKVVELNGGAPFLDTGFDALVDATAESMRLTS
jgi:hypothetical protein